MQKCRTHALLRGEEPEELPSSHQKDSPGRLRTWGDNVLQLVWMLQDLPRTAEGSQGEARLADSGSASGQMRSSRWMN